MDFLILKGVSCGRLWIVNKIKILLIISWKLVNVDNNINLGRLDFYKVLFYLCCFGNISIRSGYWVLVLGCLLGLKNKFFFIFLIFILRIYI